MKGHPDIITLLNDILTGELTAINQYFLHAKMLANWGYEHLAHHVRKESIDEMKHADELIERVLFLDGVPNLQRLGKLNIGETAIEQLKNDLAMEYDAIKRLNDGIQLCRNQGDNGSEDLLKKILVSEEKHVDWLETQLELVKQLGEAHYLAQQIRHLGRRGEARAGGGEARAARGGLDRQQGEGDRPAWPRAHAALEWAPMPPLGPNFEREALRINRRFNLEIIEGFVVCPYARVARETQASVVRLRAEETPTLDALHEEIGALEQQPEVEVAQVVFPRATLGPTEMLELGGEFGKANAARYPKRRPSFVYAVFHPRLAYGTDTPPRLVSFFRRAPDPMVQLIRLSVLDAIHASKPRGTQFFDGDMAALAQLLKQKRPESVTDRITRENYERAMEGALAKIESVLADIIADRDRAYASAEAADRAGGA